MVAIDGAAPTVVERRARIAVAALFLTNGALIANILPRYPEIKDALGMSNAVYGVTLAAFPVGAILAGLTAGVLMRMIGSAKLAVLGTVLTGVGLLAAGAAPTVLSFAAALLLAGAMDALTDVAQNAHGLRVQRRYRRSIINSFHAVWSIGAVLGGVMAAGAIALEIPLIWHLLVSATLFSAVSLAALRHCLPGISDEPSPQIIDGETLDAAVRIPKITGATVVKLLALVAIAIAGTMVEDAGFSWAALYLTTLNAPAAAAASGFIALVFAQFIGRLVGDRLVDRFGQRHVARAGGLIAAVGMGIALVFPSVPGTIMGFAAAGFGVATLIPAAMQEADELPGLRPGTGLTVVSWLMRLGFLLSPPLVGLIADAAGLRVGLLSIPAAGVAVVLLSGVLRQARRTRD